MKNTIKEILKSDMYLTMSIVGQLDNLSGGFESYALYDMDAFDIVMEGYTPIEIAQRIFLGNFNPNNEYFFFNSYGNLKSIDEWEMNGHFSLIIDKVVDGILDYYHDLYINNNELNDLINEYLEE